MGHALQLKEQSETQARRFGSLRALNDELCPYCSQKCNEADLGIDFLPKKRKISDESTEVPNKKRRFSVSDDEAFFDHIVDKRTVEDQKQYLVCWAADGG